MYGSNGNLTCRIFGLLCMSSVWRYFCNWSWISHSPLVNHWFQCINMVSSEFPRFILIRDGATAMMLSLLIQNKERKGLFDWILLDYVIWPFTLYKSVPWIVLIHSKRPFIFRFFSLTALGGELCVCVMFGIKKNNAL